MKITDILLYGHENAQTMRDLVSLTGENSRAIRRAIESERRRGTPILSDNRNGYWLALDRRETERFVESMRGRASEIWRTAAAVEQAARLGGEEIH